MPDTRIKDFSSTADFPNGDDFLAIDGLVGGTRKWPARRVLDLTNPRATQGALAFDGTGRVYSDLTGTAAVIGSSDPASLVIKLTVPASNPGSPTWAFALASGTNPTAPVNTYLLVGFTTSGGLQISWRDPGSPGTAARDSTSSGFIAAYGGKTVILVIARTSTSSATVWCNATQLSFTNVDTSFASYASYFGGYGVLCPQMGSSTTYTGRVYSWSYYNLALSQADVTEIQELGGGVPFRYQFGSQVNRIVDASRNSNFSAGATDWVGDGGAAAPVVSGGKMAISMSAATQRTRLTSANAGTSGLTGKAVQWRINVANLSIPGSAQLYFNIGVTDTGIGGITSNGLNISSVHVLRYAEAIDAQLWQIRYGGTTSGTITADIDDIEIRQVGAVAHYNADLDGIGYQFHDQGANKLDAVIATAGVTWTKPARHGYVRTPGAGLTWSGTHESKSILGAAQQALPFDAVVTRITSKASVASSGSGMTLGTSSNAGWWVATNTFTTAKEKHALVNELPFGASAVHSDVLIDPDTSNYTGAIQVEVQFSITEGSV
jgi:hypothetical protein